MYVFTYFSRLLWYEVEKNSLLGSFRKQVLEQVLKFFICAQETLIPGKILALMFSYFICFTVWGLDELMQKEPEPVASQNPCQSRDGLASITSYS